ncbi:MAG: alpha/beta hydrolase [Alphaproteobacteria bacterium]|nr:alpha/beta hydrolase [Alphaproteobacteria bacterium]
MKPNRFLAFLCAAVSLAVLSGCASDSTVDPSLDAKGAPLRQQEITAGNFRLAIFSRIVDTNQPVTVYVDGGMRDFAPSGPSGADATPDGIMTLRLAEADPSDNVVYIAHPCQFNAQDAFCAEKPLPNARYAELYYTAMNRALNFALAKVQHTHLNLVGYSGGGAIAAIMAARRQDVESLRTIAGNLDPNGNGRLHGSAPKDDFIDPIKIAPKLALLPQEHYVSADDTFVPAELTDNFVKAIGLSYCVKVTSVPDATHKTGWEEMWKAKADQIPACGSFASN